MVVRVKRAVEICPESGRKFKRHASGKRRFLCEHEKASSKCRQGDCARRFKDRSHEKCPCGSGVQLQVCRQCDTPGAGALYCPKTKVVRQMCKCDDERCGGSRCEHGKQRRHCPNCDPLGHLIALVRNRTRHALKSTGSEKTCRTYEYLGCPYDDYKDHLEFSFQLGMTWGNFGEWEIGHRKPLREKDISEEESIARLHYSNTFAQWKEDNAHQGNRYHFTKY